MRVSCMRRATEACGTLGGAVERQRSSAGAAPRVATGAWGGGVTVQGPVKKQQPDGHGGVAGPGPCMRPPPAPPPPPPPPGF